MLACRLLDLSETTGIPVDRVIALKFPAYYIPHANKVLWLLHQHRQAYDLWDHTELSDLRHFSSGPQVCQAIRDADRRLIPQAKAIFTLSRNVSNRLKTFCGIDSTPLYHPPESPDRFYCEEPGDYMFFPSRISPIKRQQLVLEALGKTRHPVHVRFAGVPDHPPYISNLQRQAESLGVQHRVEWLGWISQEQKFAFYARALGVIFPPIDEDYGYVTLEAMLASKPVITCTDSGGPNEFVLPGQTGWIVEPLAESLAAAMDSLWEDRQSAASMGRVGRDYYGSLDISWRTVTQRLLA
jgi:glycosyltransferase involved in cell wall biosynthesis